jgi:hypothetical protein
VAAKASPALEGGEDRLGGQKWQWLVAQIGEQHGLNGVLFFELGLTGVDEGLFRYLLLDDDVSETLSLQILAGAG